MPVSRPIKIRLFVDASLSEGQDVVLSREQAHYLFGVMRQKLGGHVLLFNGRDGEWRATVKEAGKRNGVLECEEKVRPQSNVPDIWLLFAPVKKARTDFIVEKAVEMGVRRITPVFTEFTNSERIRPDRLRAIATEAAEQSRRLCVPSIDEGVKLDRVIGDWPSDRALLFANETENKLGLRGLSLPIGVLVGPEGGFSTTEIARILAKPNAMSVSLGPRILRADTAAIAALSLVQITCGDWI